MANKKFNGFASEEQYLEAFENFKNIQEDNDTYDRDYFQVSKEDGYIELILNNYSIRIWDTDNVEVYILNENEHLVDNGIMNVCWAILENLREGELMEYFD